tara:strand:- start:1776 stop:2516 length:741 start_codon:yes stop_codon:yes gene_type:complete
MAVLYASRDGIILSPASTTWATVRDATTGAFAIESFPQGYTYAIRFAARGGGTGMMRVLRTYFYFDTSGITGTVADVDIKFYRYTASQAGTRMICVKADNSIFGGDGGTALANADFDNLYNWSAGSSFDGPATDYSNVFDAGSSTSGYNAFTGTSDLKSDMQLNNNVNICMMEYDHDYKNVALGTSPDTNGFFHYHENYTGTSRDPYLDYTLAPSGYGNNVNGVATANIGTVKGVATANISKVIGV